MPQNVFRFPFAFLIFAAILATAAAAGSAGCGLNPPYTLGASNPVNITTVDGNRTYHVYMPTIYNNTRPTPIVFLFHGGFGTGTQAESAYKLDPVADSNNFIAVYPDGIQAAWNAGGCCGYPMTHNIDDIGFVSSMIDSLESLLCINPAAIFATGMSNGALMAQRVGCQLSNRIAAIAPVEGTLEYFPCNISKPVAVFEIHGTADKNIPFNGGYGCGVSGTNFTSVPVTIQTWIDANGCSCPYADQATCGQVTLTDGDGTCTQFGTCNSGGNVTLCVIEGGGHTWSGAGAGQIDLPGCNKTVGTFNASLNMWNFFASTIPTSSSTTSATGASSDAMRNRPFWPLFAPFLLAWTALKVFV